MMQQANRLLFFLKSFLAASIFLCLTHCTINEVGPAGPPGIDGVSDRQIRLGLGTHTQTTDSIRIDPRYDLIRFNLNNYIELDSAIFVSFMQSQSAGVSSLVYLYNATAQAVVDTLTSRDTSGRWMQSENLLTRLTALAGREITLGIILESEDGVTPVSGGQSYLLLYRQE
ncbi:MAG: hypothetical protein HC880_17705 [Bacteroidia bacterium]|nr:hypothetical protein [Bacteroidia bacterium]